MTKEQELLAIILNKILKDYGEWKRKHEKTNPRSRSKHRANGKHNRTNKTH